MSDNNMKALIARTFLEVADALETGTYGRMPVIGLASEGSEHGDETIDEALRIADMRGVKTLRIEGGDVHKKMEELLDAGQIDGAVSMHYPFPIGVSTIGKVITPGKGRPMYLSSTTGTADTNRICAMVKNAVYGIIAAKADGILTPTVGIANVDGARQAEKALLKLREGGYPMELAESARADGGLVMRGNDLLLGTADVMVMDSLTGNLMTKIFSSFTTGGNYEALGFGYGPGIGADYERLILIVSRASGAPVIAGAMEFTASLVKNQWRQIAKAEFKKAEQAGLSRILDEIREASKRAGAAQDTVSVPAKEVCTAQIPGIEVMDLDDAVKELWRAGIYAESGMGCTGPIVLLAAGKKDAACGILKKAGYIG